ncbi:MAG: hypothetical protein Q8R45_15570 [Brevundimonas sp.]|uniref:hypothetical protein n=1 Tax=Brevundimonas sp. TaxID=1871086 RepID=UPI00271F8A70|nr:hypothetical protein [Brevundimonas sp.]MDO9586399.1 hypothetical protein [Brevundimonas sp.]MDP3369925.1 hypothetical protein [Brevundimonas sp.]MDP3658373.1 hypothetical protein [Brevundimonas sp.]MDZ4109613.1 hypothetical protein [Brevundimonas sp.]
MTPERFLALVAAWGADARRWPEAERAAAQAFAAAEPETARPALIEAETADALLHASRTPHPSMILRDRIIASAAVAGLKAGREGRRWLDRLALAFGAGWAAAACAGMVAGVMMTTYLTADARADAVLYQASLNGVDDMEVLG